MSREFQGHLRKSPDDWLKFQNIFNLSVDKVYQDIADFERENAEKDEARVYKLKKIFEKRYRPYFLHGEFIKWSYEKPLGYPGDFKIIDDIYQNQPRTTGFSRLWDNYFQQLAASKATRERKDDFKKIILEFIKERQGKDVRIMSLASGPAREIKELIGDNPDSLFSKVVFDCYDLDIRALDYAKNLIGNDAKVNFFQKNAIRLALKKDIKSEIPWDYDLIYSTGLFDYLDERIAVRLVGNLRYLLKKNGIMAIANVSEKHNNSSASWMEWVAEWCLIYRSENEFAKIFIDAGFLLEDLQIKLQCSKVMQRCFAKID